MLARSGETSTLIARKRTLLVAAAGAGAVLAQP